MAWLLNNRLLVIEGKMGDSALANGFSNCEIVRSSTPLLLQEMSGKFRWGLLDWLVAAARARRDNAAGAVNY